MTDERELNGQILIVHPDTLSAGAIKKLEKSGYIVIQTTNPENVRLLFAELPMPVVKPNTLLMAALKAAKYNEYSAKSFIDELYNRLLEEEKTITKNPIP